MNTPNWKIAYAESASATPDVCGKAIDLIGRENGSAVLSLAMIILVPGEQSKPHWHEIMHEIYYITRGEAIVTLDGYEERVIVGATIYIPPKVVHSIKNNTSEDLLFLSADAPSFDETDIYYL